MKVRLRDYVVLVIVLAAMAVVVTAKASDKVERRGGPPRVDVNQSNDMNNQTAGDVSLSAGVAATLSGGDMIGGDTTLAMDSKSIVVAAPGLGDVDIAACLGSTQWSLLVGGKQKLVLNQVCMAEFYLKQGRYDLAAQSLCNQPEIVTEYESEQACELAHDFTPPPLLALPASDSAFEEHYELAQRQEEEIEYMQAEQVSLVGRIDMLTEQIEQAPAPVIVQQEVPVEYTDEQFEAVFMALKGSDEDER